MIAAPLPECDPVEVKRRLYTLYKVEIPITVWNGQNLIRASFQGYNSADDLERLMRALGDILNS